MHERTAPDPEDSRTGAFFSAPTAHATEEDIPLVSYAPDAHSSGIELRTRQLFGIASGAVEISGHAREHRSADPRLLDDAKVRSRFVAPSVGAAPLPT